VEKHGNLVKAAICNQLLTILETMEQAVLEKLELLRKTPEFVAQLIGEEDRLSAQVNAGENKFLKHHNKR